MLDVEIDLDRKRTLRYDWPGLAAMDREFRKSAGRSTVQLLQEMGETIAEDFDVMQTLVWGGLRHQTKHLSPDDVGRLLGGYLERGGDTAELWAKITEAFWGSGLFTQKSPAQSNGAGEVADDPDPTPARNPRPAGSKRSSAA